MNEFYFDCSAGISGNMILGALLNLGISGEEMITQFTKLPLPLPEIKISQVKRNGIGATLVEVKPIDEHHHRHLADIIKLISVSGLEEKVIKESINCFRLLAEAEAKIHQVSVDEIHFHEVGAVDAIIDIVGSCWGLQALGCSCFRVSPIRVGFGTVNCAHGLLPVPAPAALELLNGFQIYGGDYEGEWATPTGAAILKNFGKVCTSIPEMKVNRIGYGAGTSERKIANLLRIITGEILERKQDESTREFQMVIETNIDDMNPEVYSHLSEKLLKSGAKDYYITPVYMKKNRPGALLTVIAPPERTSDLESIILKETTTLGLRKYQVERRCLKREQIIVEINGNPIRVKLGFLSQNEIKISPEYEDCHKLAESSNGSFNEIYEVAKNLARKVVETRGTVLINGEL